MKAERVEGPPAAAFVLGHRPALDGVRGIAILAVVLRHLRPEKFPLGFLGVDVFFTLSGFLITALLVGEWRRAGRIDLRAFYIRRGLRLLPALFLMLAVWGIVTAALAPDMLARFGRAALYAACYCGNWVMAFDHDGSHPMWPLEPTWSLGIEEQFYILWPIILIGLLRLRLRPPLLAAFVGMGAMAAWMWRAKLALAGVGERRLLYGLDTRGDALLIGCFAGILVAWDLLPARPWARALAHAAVVGLVPLFAALQGPLHTERFFQLGGFTLVAAATGLVLVDVVLFSPSAARLLELPPLVWLGKISYGVYLWHAPVLETLSPARFPSVPTGALLAVQLGAVIALPALSFVLVERRLLALKSRWAAQGPRK